MMAHREEKGPNETTMNKGLDVQIKIATGMLEKEEVDYNRGEDMV